MSNLEQLMGRREVLRIMILGALITLGGCGEMTQSEKKFTERRAKFNKRSKKYRERLLRKVREGWEGGSPPAREIAQY
jgi:hypothetical protein